MPSRSSKRKLVSTEMLSDEPRAKRPLSLEKKSLASAPPVVVEDSTSAPLVYTPAEESEPLLELNNKSLVASLADGFAESQLDNAFPSSPLDTDASAVSDEWTPQLESPLDSQLDSPSSFSILGASPAISTSSGLAADNTSTTLIDDFIDYESMCEDSGSESASDESAPSTPRPEREAERPVSLCSYRDRHVDSMLSNLQVNRRHIDATWAFMVQDMLPAMRAAYVQNVLIAATGLKQSSIKSGLARQTMGPAAKV